MNKKPTNSYFYKSSISNLAELSLLQSAELKHHRHHLPDANPHLPQEYVPCFAQSDLSQKTKKSYGGTLGEMALQSDIPLGFLVA